MLPAHVVRIPNTGWVECLFLEEADDQTDVDDILAQITSVLERSFPNLSTLLISNGYYLPPDDNIARSKCSEWLGKHLPSLEHLKFDELDGALPFDPTVQPGLTSMNFPSFSIRPRTVVAGWSVDVRAKLQALDE